jgi:hypothetical protein
MRGPVSWRSRPQRIYERSSLPREVGAARIRLDSKITNGGRSVSTMGWRAPFWTGHGHHLQQPTSPLRSCRRTRPYRVVFGLNRDAVQAKNAEFEEGQSLEVGRLPIVEFIEPLSDENPRLVSQSGLFTRAPIGMPIEGWIAQAFEGSGVPALLRIEIPDRDRGACLRGLDRMNINHLSLFPDLAGASRFANIMLELGR